MEPYICNSCPCWNGNKEEMLNVVSLIRYHLEFVSEFFYSHVLHFCFLFHSSFWFNTISWLTFCKLEQNYHIWLWTPSSADQIIHWWSAALNVVSTNGMKLIPCNYECNTGLERGLFISLFLFFLSSSSSFGYLLSSSSCTGYLLCTALTTWLCGASLW